MAYFIGIDSGTQSTKCVVINNKDGSVIGTGRQAYGLQPNLPPTHKEQEPIVWIRALKVSISQALKEAKIAVDQIEGMGISGQQHGFVPLDKDGQVIRPAKLWNDTSSFEQCETILARVGGLEAFIDKIGMGLPPGYTASKILWLKENEPENYERLATVLLPHDYLNFYLTGEYTMEYGDASGTALMNIRTRTWQNDVIDAIDPQLKSALPPLNPSHRIIGTLRESIAEELGLSPQVKVSAGGGDNMMGAIGTGNTKPGIVTASLGTSGTIYAFSDQPVSDPHGEIGAFCDSTSGWLPLVCTQNVTGVTELLKKKYNWNDDQLTQYASKAPVGSNGLLMLPYLEAERTPDLPKATGMYWGINPQSYNKENEARATMEGITLGMNYGLNILRNQAIQPQQIRLTGGGANNALWRGVVSKVFNAKGRRVRAKRWHR